MKILQLNVWTGRLQGAIIRFIKENNFDVICLQEAVWPRESDKKRQLEYFAASVQKIKDAGNFDFEAKASNWGAKIEDEYFEQGNVILSKIAFDEVEIKELCGTYEHRTMSADEVNDQLYTAIRVKLSNGFTIFNYHGYWKPDPIGDEKTVEVMHLAADMIRDIDTPLVMCGDLNVIHESPAMRELDFLRDLIYENGIKTTLAGLKYNGEVACDHILVNDSVVVSKFMVHKDIVSDHLALSLECNLG